MKRYIAFLFHDDSGQSPRWGRGGWHDVIKVADGVLEAQSFDTIVQAVMNAALKSITYGPARAQVVDLSTGRVVLEGNILRLVENLRR